MSTILNPDQSKGTTPAVSGHNRNLLANLKTSPAQQPLRAQETEPEQPEEDDV